MLLALILAARFALAIDGHGATVIPSQPGVVDARYTWDGDLGGKGTWSAGVLGEAVSEPVTVVYNTGRGDDTEIALLDGLYGLNLRGAVSLSRRLGFGIVAPVWLSRTEWDANTGETNVYGAQLGDIHLSVPVGIVRPVDGKGLAIAAVGEFIAPTGPRDSLIGGGVGGGVQVAAGYRAGMLHLAADLGVQGAAADQFDNVDDRATLRVAALAGVEPFRFLGLAAELWATPSLSDPFAAASSPAEIALSATGVISHRFVVTAAGSTAISGGAGAAERRITLGLGWQARPRVTAAVVPLEPVAAGPAGPYDLVVSATDDRDRPVDAHVHLLGSTGSQDWQLGKDGRAQLPLGPGAWDLTLSQAGRETQERHFELDEGRWRPLEVSARLLPRTGDQRLSVLVTDNEARGVENAEVVVDAEVRGTTSNMGALTIDGVAAGAHDVQASGADFVGPASLSVGATPDGNDTTFTDMPAAVVTLARPPGAVRVLTRSQQGPVVDAAVRFIAAGSDSGEPQEERGAEPIGEDGERTFQLTPGRWTAVVSAAAFGIQERDIVIEPGQTTLVNVDVVLATQVGQAGLNVRVVDPDGRPVEGAEVLLGDRLIGSTSNVGSLAVTGLQEGDTPVTVRGHGLRATVPRVVNLVAGTRDLVLSIDYLPGTVEILARGPDGPVQDAMVRFIGSGSEPARALGPDGRGMYTLAGGDWEVVLSSAEFGLQSRDVVVRPDETSLIFIDARLLTAEKGESTLVLSVRDPEGRPVEGARIRLDGAEVGTTSTGGDLTLGALQAGTRSIAVDGDIFQEFSSDAVELKSGSNPVRVDLEYKTAVVRLRAHDPANKPVDAMVRLYGAMSVQPARLGPGGERLFALTPGPWSVALSSETLGVSEKDFTVVESPIPAVVDMLVAAPGHVETSLMLAVVDTEGQPVRGANATIGSVTQVLGDDGAVELEGLEPGPLPLRVVAPGYKPAADATFTLAAGAQERTLHMVALPRTLRVRLLDPKSKPIDGEVIVQRAAGKPGSAVKTGADGTFEQDCLPGGWRVIAAARGFGAQQVDVDLPAGEGVFPVSLTLMDARVGVTAQQVTISDQVHFPTNSAAVSAESFRILDEVASTLLVHPEIRAVEVQGHTDDVGGAEYNLDLSQRRANAVRLYLIAKGIEPARLVAKGYGMTVPVAENTSERGRARNRRVQFVIGR